MRTVLVCDEVPLAGESLRRIVTTLPGVARVSCTRTAEELLVGYETERPALVLLALPATAARGVEAARRLLTRHPEASVVLLATPGDAETVAEIIALGARGFVMRDATREELGAVVGQALADPGWRSRPRVPATGEAPAPLLTEREMQVLSGMSRGRSNAEIGRELYLSEDTIKTHARRLFRKLGAADRAHAVAMGFRCGLVR